MFFCTNFENINSVKLRFSELPFLFSIFHFPPPTFYFPLSFPHYRSPFSSHPLKLRLFNLAWPLFLELWLGIAVGVVCTALAARASDAAGGAFALSNQLAGTLFILFRIVGAGISVVVTQSVGGGRRDAADAVARAALGASTWLGGICALLALIGATPFLQLLNAPADVLPLAGPFLQACAITMLFDAWNASISSVMRAHMRSREVLMVIVAMHLTHLALAWVLMGGAGVGVVGGGVDISVDGGLVSIPPLGLIGFAIAMGISRLLGLALNLWLWKVQLGLVPRWGDWWRLPRRELAALLHIGLPGAAENIAYRLCFMASIAVAAQLGTQSLATQAYVSQIMYGVLLFGLATGLSVEIAVGHLIGAGRLHEANQMLRRALAGGLAMSVVVALFTALLAPTLLGFFTQDANIIATGTTLLWITVLLEPGRTFNLVVINALRAAGDARFPVVAGAASMLIVLAGGSWLLGIHFGLGLKGLWIAYAADEWIRGLMMWRRWSSLGWVKYARATSRRLRKLQSIQPPTHQRIDPTAT